MLNKIALGITDLGKDFKAKVQMLVKVFSENTLLVCFLAFSFSKVLCSVK